MAAAGITATRFANADQSRVRSLPVIVQAARGAALSISRYAAVQTARNSRSSV
jgi:hypothetical protein